MKLRSSGLAKVAAAKPVHVGFDTFQSTVLNASVPVLVDFWAPWCGPCKAVAPVLDEIARELEGRAIVAKVNVDDEPELAQIGRIRSIPTLVVFKGGAVADAFIGAQRKEVLVKALQRAGA